MPNLYWNNELAGTNESWFKDISVLKGAYQRAMNWQVNMQAGVKIALNLYVPTVVHKKYVLKLSRILNKI